MQTVAKPLAYKLALGLAAGALALSLTACGGNKWGFPYRADIQQGNWITAEQVARLEQGMTREQVRFILGTPTLQDVFRANRWDYPYYNKPGYGPADNRHFTVWFEDDLLVRWAGDQQPDHQPFQVPTPGPVGTIPESGANADFPGQQYTGPTGIPVDGLGTEGFQTYEENVGIELNVPTENNPLPVESGLTAPQPQPLR